jgi:glycosyltransferase involved in cell wall biosynthesis
VKPCLLIPIYQHGSTIRGVVRSLEQFDLPCFIVNDGSDAATCAALDGIEEEFDWVEVEHHAVNRGKGVALRQGYRLAARRGFTHVVQLDAERAARAADVAASSRPRASSRRDRLGRPSSTRAPEEPRLRRGASQGLVWLVRCRARCATPCADSVASHSPPCWR